MTNTNDGRHPYADANCNVCGGYGYVLHARYKDDGKIDPDSPYIACKCTNINERGDAALFALIGLLIGSVMLYVESGNKAQEQANLTGREVHQANVIRDDIGTSAATLLLPAAAGWGVGYVLDNVAGSEGDEKSQDNGIEISGNSSPVTVNITGNPQTETTTTDNSTEIK